jgi:hypothetical protein
MDNPGQLFHQRIPASDIPGMLHFKAGLRSGIKIKQFRAGVQEISTPCKVSRVDQRITYTPHVDRFRW